MTVSQRQRVLRHVNLRQSLGSDPEEVSLWFVLKRNSLEITVSRNTEIQFNEINKHGKIISTSNSAVSLIEEQEKNTLRD